MPPTKSTIRASEIGSFLYCQRAWSYQRQGLASANIEEFDGGALVHERHGAQMRTTGRLRTFAYLLIGLALILLLINFL